MEQTWTHTTVLLNEAVDALLNRPVELPDSVKLEDGHYVDATFGRGGHSRLLLSRLSPQARLTAFDKDPQAVAEAERVAESDPRFSIRHQGFAQLSDLPAQSCQGLLMDLGISSPQIDDPARGFSFRAEGPLDMRMDPTRGRSVAEWLRVAEVREIAEVIRDYGEERFAGPIAKAIVERRQAGRPLATTAELAQLVAGAVKTREPGQNPATRTFQAFRIFINAELEELQAALEASLDVLQTGGRLVVISFHSLEDRIVKQFIARHAREVYDRRAPFAAPTPTRLRAVERLRPSEAEVAANPRARSAIMRVAVRTDAERGEA
ncbi:16S rRNA (cytosine(1402)-N(4))-methyltransferase RsmH [Hylemonella gracilis]|uniref:Ribosomal RNA small subunit methyltransferase H n=1 Tax=Hylemonella gracilis TaxID=80880 RepID=A0A4P6UHQ8_9BURK|nr:16S rRNA (cytosine(1402)-N(4))-methyltransferase RsmH [Hylemonella gracilis]QBK04463.1 16S rRNA (cytosine(1402)-N(4))-methyltransferase RsmH [Hylemonella gracilis]